jgi:hypothetical protein
VEHVVRPAVDQGDPPALEAPEEAVEDGDRRREEPALGDLDELLRKYLCSGLGGDGLLPTLPGAGGYLGGSRGEVGESARRGGRDVSPRSKAYLNGHPSGFEKGRQMDPDIRPTLVSVAAFVAALALSFWLLTSGLDFLVLLSLVVIPPLSLFALVFLWRFPLGRVAAPPEQVLASIAQAMRRSLYRVTEEPGQLTVRTGSLSAVKVRARPVPEGTALSYTVYATPAGWSLIMIVFILLYQLVMFTAPAVLYILLQVRGFVRERVLPLVASGGLPPFATPGGDVRTVLIEGLSEGYRIASEASEAEHSTYHDLLLLAFALGLVTWALVFPGVFVSSVEPDFVQRLLVSSVVALLGGTGVALGSGLLIRHVLRPRLLRLDLWTGQLRDALAREAGWAPLVGEPKSTLELLIEASSEVPTWLSALRRGGLSREPGTWVVIVLAAFWGLFLIGAAGFLAASLPLVAIIAGTGGAGLVAGTYFLYRGWHRRVDAEKAQIVSSWDRRLAAIRAQMEQFLQDL